VELKSTVERDPWELMFAVVKGLYNQLLDDGFSMENLPREDEGDSVDFDGVVLKVVVQHQWSGNAVGPKYPVD
jgi:hypothetical protein